MLPYAIKCIEDNNNIKSGTKVKGIYESYLSQFGPMSIQLGLRSTLAVYQNKSGSNNKGDRKFILDMILEVLKETSFILNNDNRETWINNHLKNTGEIMYLKGMINKEKLK